MYTEVHRAASNFTSAPKAHIYDLLRRLNAAFARAARNLFELEKVGIFDSKMMKAIYDQTKEAQASANFPLLESLREREAKDWTKYGRKARQQTE